MERVITLCRDLPEGSVIIAGHWLLMIEPTLAASNTREDRYALYLGRPEVEARVKEGAPVYYLPGVAERTMTKYHSALDAAGARPLVRQAEVATPPYPLVPTRYMGGP